MARISDEGAKANCILSLFNSLLESYLRLGSNESYLGSLASSSSQFAFDETKL
ncbi:hypothetical protein QWZ13_14040 [Reinekea marina]|uniref:hypothetical protein n=1 Tax=Reinekea marina TaxID=1310421 RepID=UPI0025B58816|nr:hypothetical protein [Reinekea marina]MDN3650037.1 hypothetical protein [Reinekea marina]